MTDDKVTISHATRTYAPSYEAHLALADRIAVLEASQGVKGRPFNSGNFSEQVDALPVTTSGADKQIVYSVALGNLKAGDRVKAFAEIEATNDLGFNVMMASQIILSAGGPSTSGKEITEANARNITPGMHHDTQVKAGAYTLTRDMADAYVVLVAYAKSSAASAGDTIRVEQDYGRLWGEVIPA